MLTRRYRDDRHRSPVVARCRLHASRHLVLMLTTPDDCYMSTSHYRLPTLATDALTRRLLGSKPSNPTNRTVCKRGCIKLHSHDTHLPPSSKTWELSPSLEGNPKFGDLVGTSRYQGKPTNYCVMRQSYAPVNYNSTLCTERKLRTRTNVYPNCLTIKSTMLVAFARIACQGVN